MKNEESYWLDREHDRQGLVRTMYKYTGTCPFPDCTPAAWNKARPRMWSLESAEKVLAYLKYHGMESGLHGKKVKTMHCFAIFRFKRELRPLLKPLLLLLTSQIACNGGVALAYYLDS